jgi:polysaccharide biosynthesis protein PelA
MIRVTSLVRLALVLLAFAAGLGQMRPAAALDIEFSGRTVRREILALYDARHERTPQKSRIHMFAEMPLNWLGYKLVYADVNAPLPPVVEMSRYRGVLTWFIEPMAATETYLPWLDSVTAAGTKLTFLSEMVPTEPPNFVGVATRILARLGLVRTNYFASVTHHTRATIQDPEMVGFERAIDKALPDFRVYGTLPGKATVHLSARTPSREGWLEAALVTTSPGGGYASDEFTIFNEPNTDKALWILNPFVFFKKAFGDDRFPVPDVTTLMGRRMYLSHIDGDGWNNVSEIEKYRDAQVTSAEVIRREVIAPYPDLPVSVGLIAGDVLPDLGGTLAGRDIARKIFELPQVEVASHTYTHPFNWSFFASYQRAIEEEMIEKGAKPTGSIADRMRSELYKTAGKTLVADKSNKYIAGSDALPRTYLKEPFDLTKEVQGALNVSESLAPPGKKAMLYMWSGDTTPFEAAIAATRAAGVRNINGGDSRLDKEFPSVLFVPPISRPVGKERQIFAVNSNENTYTNDWLGPYYGFFMLQRTLENTEKPRRLKPFNLYYHMYSGEKASALASVKHFVALARSSNLMPVATSRYAGIADDFFGVDIEQIDVSAWTIFNRGTLSTVRFDDADLLEIDGARSSGVLGGNRHQGSLYVSLDPAMPRAIVALRPRGQTGQRQAADPIAQVIESRWQLSARTEGACGFQVEAQGFGPGQMTWSTDAGRAFRIVIEQKDKVLLQEIQWADANGLIRLNPEFSALDPVTLRFDCHE